MIGLTKNCLKKVLGKALVSLTVLETVLTKVECILNDRPLMYVSSDPVDEEALTLSHLFYRRRITSVSYPDERVDETETNITHGMVNRRSQHVQQMTEHVWNRWRNEYLTSLREFHGSPQKELDGHNVKVGDVVLFHDKLPRNKWPLSVIEEIKTGGDGLIPSARVQTKGGITTRPITKLHPLEISCDE